jgi:hypothetical protein
VAAARWWELLLLPLPLLRYLPHLHAFHTLLLLILLLAASQARLTHRPDGRNILCRAQELF